MSGWKQKKYDAGSEVVVTSIDGYDLGIGILLYDFDEDSEDNIHPEIRMSDGEIMLGCECWWCPLEEFPENERKSLKR